MQNSFTDVTQLEENVVLTETFYAEEKSIKREMTYQKKPRVHSLIAEFWQLQRNNYYFCVYISKATPSIDFHSLRTSNG